MVWYDDSNELVNNLRLLLSEVATRNNNLQIQNAIQYILKELTELHLL